MDYKELQARQFEKIWKENKRLFQRGKVYIDPYLDKIEQDSRRSLTSIVRVSIGLKPKIQSVIEKLKRVAPNQYYYPPESLHLTIQNIKATADPPTWTSEEALRVKEVFANVLDNYRSFIMELKGLNIFSRAIFVQGFCDEILFKLRNNLDRELKEINIYPERKYKYKLNFGWVNIARFRNSNVHDLLNEIEKLRNYNFGTMKINKIELVETDRYFLKPKTKIIATFELK